MKRNNSNSKRLTVYLHNPHREGSEKGSNKFKTTHTYKDVQTLDDALGILDLFENMKINKAFYDGKLIVLNGKFIETILKSM